MILRSATIEVCIEENLAMAAVSSSPWIPFLKSVDDDEPEESELNAASEFMTKLFASPQKAYGVRFDALSKHPDFPKDLALQAFLSRALETLEAAQRAKNAAAQLASAKQQAAPQPSLSNAMGLASALAPPKSCDTQALLNAASMGDLPFVNQCDQAVWDRLHADTSEAKVQNRSAYAYIDLTSPGVLPIWLYAEAVGGKSNDIGEHDVDVGAEVQTLAKLGQALRGATAGRLFFRSVQQWNGAYWRYALVAIAAEQITMVQAAIHCDMIMQLAEQEKIERRPPYLAFLYDELLRKQIEKRVQKRDPNIILTDIFSTLDKQLLEVAKQRLTSALKLAGIATKEPHQEVAASALQQQQDVMDRAGRAMASQQLPWMRGNGRAASSGSQPQAETDEERPISKRKQNKKTWWQDNKHLWRGQAGHKKGGHGKKQRR